MESDIHKGVTLRTFRVKTPNNIYVMRTRDEIVAERIAREYDCLVNAEAVSVEEITN